MIFFFYSRAGVSTPSTTSSSSAARSSHERMHSFPAKQLDLDLNGEGRMELGGNSPIRGSARALSLMGGGGGFLPVNSARANENVRTRVVKP